MVLERHEKVEWLVRELNRIRVSKNREDKVSRNVAQRLLNAFEWNVERALAAVQEDEAGAYRRAAVLPPGDALAACLSCMFTFTLPSEECPQGFEEFDCGHRICRDICLPNMIESRMSSEENPHVALRQCAEPSCKGMLPAAVDMPVSLMRPEMREECLRRDDAEQQSQLETPSSSIQLPRTLSGRPPPTAPTNWIPHFECPSPSCDKYLTAASVRGAKSLSTVMCACQTRFCFLCKEAPHEPTPCRFAKAARAVTAAQCFDHVDFDAQLRDPAVLRSAMEEVAGMRVAPQPDFDALLGVEAGTMRLIFPNEAAVEAALTNWWEFAEHDAVEAALTNWWEFAEHGAHRAGLLIGRGNGIVLNSEDADRRGGPLLEGPLRSRYAPEVAEAIFQRLTTRGDDAPPPPPPPPPPPAKASHAPILAPEVFIKICPGCIAPVERERGCNSMTCLVCRTKFCWHCLNPRCEVVNTHGACPMNPEQREAGQAELRKRVVEEAPEGALVLTIAAKMDQVLPI